MPDRAFVHPSGDGSAVSIAIYAGRPAGAYDPHPSCCVPLLCEQCYRFGRHRRKCTAHRAVAHGVVCASYGVKDLTISNAELCECAIDLARQGGRLAVQRLGEATASLKADRSWVTDVDHAVQALILGALAERFPDHAVVAEETLAEPDLHADASEAKYCWVIDPIDGTRNYVRGFPVFSTSVGVLCEGEPVAGVVYDPLTDRTYSATRGGGACLNGKRIVVREEGQQFDTMVGVPSDRRKPIPEAVSAWRKTMVLRCMGSSALNLAMVAAGCLDAAYAQETRIWDVAAGALLVQEAGGVLTDLKGRSVFPFDAATYDGSETPFLAAGAKLHGELITSFA